MIRALADAVERSGVPRSLLLEGTRFDDAVLADTSERVAIEEYDAIIERALDLTGDAAFGIHYSERLGADETRLSFDRALPDATQLHHDPEVHALLESQAERRIGSLEAELSYPVRVRHLLLEGIASRGRDMEAVARALGVSVRSLRRRLQMEGTSFADLADETRATLAKRLLAEHGRAIDHAAYELGFSDPRAFHRAFKRWTGTTPSEFRRARNS